MGLFGGDSKSSSNQTTRVISTNSQGNTAPVSGKNLNQVDLSGGGGSYAMVGGNSNVRIYGSDAEHFADKATEISLSALSYYDEQNKRSIKLAEKVAQATTSSNKDIINELAKITEKQSQSEALTLNEQMLKYGVGALIGYFIFQGARRA